MLPAEDSAKTSRAIPATNQMVQIAADGQDPDGVGPLQGAAPAVQVRHRWRLLPAVPHGAVPHHAEGQAGHLRRRRRHHHGAQPAARDRGRHGGALRSRPHAGANAEAGRARQGRRLQDHRPDPAAGSGAILRRSTTERHATTCADAPASWPTIFMTQFAWSEEPNATLKLAPQKRQALWKKLGIEPAGHRFGGGGAAAPHAHGRGPRLPPPDHGRAEVQPGRRLGRLDDRHDLSPTSCSARRSRSAAG